MNRRQAVFSLWTTCLIWGAAFPLVKLALGDASPMAFTAARFLLATVLVSPSLREVTREEWLGGATLGVLLAIGFATQTIGLQWTTPSRSGFLTSLYIPFTPLVVLAIYRTLPDRFAGLGLVVAVTGMSLLTRSAGLEGGLNRGDLLTLLCAVAFACHMVATSHFARRQRVERLMMAQIVTAGVLTTLATPLLETPRLHWSPLLVGMICYEAALASVVAIRMQLSAQRVLSPTYAALVYTLEPVIAALTSLVLTGDRLAPIQWLGGGLIIAGSLVPELRKRPAAASSGRPQKQGGEPPGPAPPQIT